MHRLFLVATLLLAACTSSEGIGPSLAKRPVEGRDLNEPVRPIASPAPADAVLRAQIGGVIERAQSGQRAFAALLPKAENAAGSAGKQGSESWIAAQQLISALETARAPSTQALSELDAMITTHLNSGSEAGTAELQAADTQVSVLVETQQRDLDHLRTRVSG